ncbi:His/Gly/Thr/Pro-type tRNA ligase C-terminal domain-containing protein, partial [Nguyenibacter vanlangensis]
EGASATALLLLQSLRARGVRAEIAYRGNAKRRMERANRIGATHAILIGEDEVARGVAQVKALDDGTQAELALDAVAPYLAGRDG